MHPDNDPQARFDPDVGSWVWGDSEITVPIYCHDCHEVTERSDGKTCANCGSTNISID